MRILSFLSSALLLLTISCAKDKYDNKRNDIQREEAIDMVKKSKNIEIKKGFGDDKIILKDE
ncbi:MAG: hypothetical protein ACJ76H_04430 [Bacteriovoracaceae bacterium]